MNLSRRKFIIILITSIIGVLAGNFLFLGFYHVVGRILSDQLRFLSLDTTAIDQFTLNAAREHYYQQKDFGWKKQLFVRIHHYFSWIPVLPGREKYRQYCDFFIQDFLLSTDFFLNKMDESRRVSYVALYEPYKRACSNPFSNLYYPDL